MSSTRIEEAQWDAVDCDHFVLRIPAHSALFPFRIP